MNIAPIPRAVVRDFPIALRGRLIKTELGLLTGPLSDGNTEFNIFKKLNGECVRTSVRIGLKEPCEDPDHAFYDRPTESELNEIIGAKQRAIA